eukprot:m.71139 g.71139  ORF g.71139 m.71139 type:complete len:482 (+) comp7921_c0_seq1:112-1557(+)
MASVKRARVGSPPPADAAASSGCQRHRLWPRECAVLRRELLKWFETHRRPLPWRLSTAKALEAAQSQDAATAAVTLSDAAYRVWVSEIMCQQTRIAAVLPYYERWMERWPTTKSLAAASLEEVNAVWSGLGYYSRAQRLLSAAQMVEEDYNGIMPSTASGLQRLPGIGVYTSHAIASVVYGEQKGVVDGNVIRVLTRLRVVGAVASSSVVSKFLQALADQIVCGSTPGAVNEAMMELGALVCTPKSPSCHQCPLATVCLANLGTQGLGDNIFHRYLLTPRKDCNLCGDTEAQGSPKREISFFPNKAKKKPSPVEEHVALIVTAFLPAVAEGRAAQRKYLVFRNPETGLLANMWRFAQFPDQKHSPQEEADLCLRLLGISLETPRRVGLAGTTKHVFSHVKHSYRAICVHYHGQAAEAITRHTFGGKWVSLSEFDQMGVSTNMRQVMKKHRDHCNIKASLLAPQVLASAAAAAPLFEQSSGP